MSANEYVLVTGASRGIGSGTVKALMERGEHVIATSRLVDYDIPGAKVLSVDLASDVSIERLAKQLQKEGVRLKGLVNNAGALITKPFEEMLRKDFETMGQINWIGPAMLTQALLPMMVEGCHVVNISSMGGFQGASKYPGLSAYASAKGALSILSECMHVELADKGISVNALALGAVQTDMLAQAFPDYQAPVTSDRMGAFIAEFALNGHQVMSGKVLPVALSNP